MLEGVKVIDFSHYLPGPFASLRLADLGAEVVKIEPPTGDKMRELADECIFAANNAGKQSISLNLKLEEDVRIAKSLIKEADVIIESFRPGVMKRLGLGYDEISQINPAIIYCSISGYGQNSPASLLGSHDLNYMALTGVLAQLKDSQGRPVHPTITMADFIGSLHAVEQMIAALYARERTGKGRYLDLSLVDGLLSLMTNHFVQEHKTKSKNGIQLLAGIIVSYYLYETKDGRYVSLAALEPNFWKNFCSAVGHPEWCEHHISPANDDNVIFREIKQLFQSKTLEQWAEFSMQIDCCLTPVFETDEAKILFSSERYRKMIHIEEDRIEVATCYDRELLKKRSHAPKINEHKQDFIYSIGE
ncbi:coA-transferase III family protein [Anoxybacillus sp. B7M1]|uniref:CoA transferase n=1 Tax=Anoxybacteroides rupiense TaxID=311460 RepID=A0ABD5IQP8_9BACL|nr:MULTISPECIES: CoA transferase [Anoxybacillus]ANB55714.1 coA-transferase III family protein [Anoxybacillus sp. B2M1]ANB65825.1 coA-transferase III family protein [Anoxybacillus sp. B7M1]KXG10666.1 Acetyl-CoA:oxalate CoA-transferase [Anoxybacillus sp. P3H1B]MBB3906048.1 crotonobetainyl-CoA:carnitine CoA-transferase CaiB-like acyl-CoA transferase [Anoxybacillus rupiensis]MED5050592.1 CoA transferase [Anoxybacillus rupiensis]